MQALQNYVVRNDGEAITQEGITNGLWEIRYNGQRVDNSLFSSDQYAELDITGLTGLNILEEDVITLEFFTQLEGENCITYSEESYEMTNGNLMPIDESLSPTTTTTISTTTTTSI